MIAKDLIIPRRSDFVFEAHFKSGGTPLSVAGWKFWFTAKRSLNDLDEAALFQKVTTPAMGTSVSIHINENDTSVAGEFFYDFKALSPAGYGAPLQGGVLSIAPVATLATS